MIPRTKTSALVLLLVSLFGITFGSDDNGLKVEDLTRSGGRVIELPLYYGSKKALKKRASGTSAIGLGDSDDVYVLGSVSTCMILKYHCSFPERIMS